MEEGMKDMFGKSERGMKKAEELSEKPESDFDPARLSVELNPKEVQTLRIMYNMINPNLAPDIKSLAKYIFLRGMDSAVAEARVVMKMGQVMKDLPPELKDLLEGFDNFGKGGPEG